jgi:uncharacterized protein
MIVKKHSTSGRLILAICDPDLIGKKFTEEKKQLDLTSSFYNGEETEEKELKKLIKQAYMLNLVGKKAIDFALKNKLIEKGNILFVAKIPHAQVLFF